MKLTTIQVDGREEAAIVVTQGAVTIKQVNESHNRAWATSVGELLESGAYYELLHWYQAEGLQLLEQLPLIHRDGLVHKLLYPRPRKIWGIGFNYRTREEGPAPAAPGEEPVGFMKPDTTLIGPGEAILLPLDAGTITAEAELAIVIGRTCRNVSEADAPNYVAGFAPSLDMTAADIHAANPRFLTRAKSFNTFLSIGPELVSVDEFPQLPQLEVITALNGTGKHRNYVGHMRFDPWWIVAFHSRVMTLLPGDILLTGTPGAVVIRAGDFAECRIPGMSTLRNPVQHAPAINERGHQHVESQSR